MNTRLLSLVALSLFMPKAAEAQDFLDLAESPAASGLFSARLDSAYTATGFANGITWLLNAEGGDLATFKVRTTAFSNSLPLRGGRR